MRCLTLFVLWYGVMYDANS